jgi:GalNAc5-diNAcBac-PP-undecaprenol beta-1,3-glucosyltransferase
LIENGFVEPMPDRVQPMISLIMPTYNRASVIGRAIESVLAQTHTDWELVIVDGASTDATDDVVRSLGDVRIRLVKQPENRGPTSGRNVGLDEARGDWIGMLDSDDELVPHALGTLMQVLKDVDPRLDAISCNCIDSRTGRLSGKGLSRDQYLTVPLSLDRASGEHWGIFRRSILGSRRFDERVRGYEGVVWHRIHDGVRWYYIHKALRVFHTEGQDRTSLSVLGDYERYKAIIDHDFEYVTLLERWSTKAYRRFLWNAAGQFLFAGDEERYRIAFGSLRASGARAALLALAVGRATRPVLRLAWSLRAGRSS